MKVRSDFVTNSSSSSFLIMTKNQYTKQELKNELSDIVSLSNGLFPMLGIDIANVLVSNANELTIEEFMDEYIGDYDFEELKNQGGFSKTVYNNYNTYPFILVGFVSDEEGGLEAFLCDADIDFKNDKMIIVKYGGY